MRHDTHLNMVQSRSLREVRHRMFKQRIAKWKLQKYRKATNRHKGSENHVDSKSDDFQKSSNRNGEGKQPEGENTGASTSAVLWRQKMVSSMPLPPLSSPPELKFAEIILQQTEIYHESFIPLAIEHRGKELMTAVVNLPGAVDPFDFVNKIELGFEMLGSGQPRAAWLLLNEVSEFSEYPVPGSDAAGVRPYLHALEQILTVSFSRLQLWQEQCLGASILTRCRRFYLQ